jgi:hypothetical protein
MRVPAPQALLTLAALLALQSPAWASTVVLKDGQIAESGTHEQLITCGGIYAKFAEEQRIQSELEKLGEVEFPPAQLGVVGP